MILNDRLPKMLTTTGWFYGIDSSRKYFLQGHLEEEKPSFKQAG